MTWTEFSLIEKNKRQSTHPTPVRMIFLDIDDPALLPSFFIAVLKKIFRENYKYYPIINLRETER